MFRNLAGNLVLHERIRTTDAKAKELRRIIERLITRAVRLGDDLTIDIGTITDDARRSAVMGARIHAQREVAKFLPRHMGTEEEMVDLVHKLFHEIAPRFVERAKENKGGGYTRIVKLPNRKGDNAPISMIEIIGAESFEAKQTRLKEIAAANAPVMAEEE